MLSNRMEEVTKGRQGYMMRHVLSTLTGPSSPGLPPDPSRRGWWPARMYTEQSYKLLNVLF